LLTLGSAAEGSLFQILNFKSAIRLYQRISCTSALPYTINMDGCACCMAPDHHEVLCAEGHPPSFAVHKSQLTSHELLVTRLSLVLRAGMAKAQCAQIFWGSVS
jgi:hypothetical protein